MHFVWPEALWTLLTLPLLWAAYVWMIKRQRAQALRFPSLMLLRPALQGQRAWRRHVPPLLLWLALACTHTPEMVFSAGIGFEPPALPSAESAPSAVK